MAQTFNIPTSFQASLTSRAAPVQAPTSQTGLDIGFVLDTGGSLQSFTLPIRPEDMVRTTPSRMTVLQTIDGDGWVDNFGQGLGQITIAGHTGWRINSAGDDWGTSFQKLKTTAFDGWHSARADAAKAGTDPNSVRLIFVDTLNNLTQVVAPVSFQLKRSKSRPLLMQYNITMSVLGAAGEYFAIDSAPTITSNIKQAALDSLSQSLAELADKTSSVQQWCTNQIAPVAQSVYNFMSQTQSVMTSVQNSVTSVGTVTTELGAVSGMIATSGMNIFHTLGSIVGLPSSIKAQLMSVASIYTNMMCLMTNSFTSGASMPNYSSFYGASACSSTSGGSPVMPYSVNSSLDSLSAMLNSSQTISVTPAATQAFTAVITSDPVLTPLSSTQLGNFASQIAIGVSFNQSTTQSVTAAAASTAGNAPSGVSSVPQQAINGVRYVQLKVNETLQQIAARELGDMSQWVTIANLNGLAYPWVTGDSGVAASAPAALWGASLMVPSGSNVISATTTPDLVYERDIAIGLNNNNGQLSDDGAGGIAVVSGVDNAMQALQNGVMVEQNELPQHYSYGCKARQLLGTIGGPIELQLISEYVKASLLSDYRTQSVSSITATTSGMTTKVSANVVLISGITLPLSVSL